MELSVSSAQSSGTWFKAKVFREEYKLDSDACINSGANNQSFKPCMENKGWRWVDKAKIDDEMKSCRNEQNSSSLTGDERIRVYFSCMEAKGWDLENRTDSSIYKISSSLRDECAKPEYREIISKSPCLISALTLDQLSDNSKITDSQKRPFAELSKFVGAGLNNILQAYRSGGLADRKHAEYYARFVTARQSLDIDLYQGKLTWGAYNSKKKEWAESIRTERAKVMQELDSFIKGQGPAPVIGSNESGVISGGKGSIDQYKEKCKDLGMKPGTEAFGKCVLQLSR